MKEKHLSKNKAIFFERVILFIFLICECLIFKGEVCAQGFKKVRIVGVYSGNETNNTLFIAKSKMLPSLAYIRAQRIEGPQDGFFTQNKDNIRYTSMSTKSGIPGNLSKIRFSFLKSDKNTPIPFNDFRFIINDIDGPNNEALATKCDAKLHFLGTANPTNLIVINLPSNIIAVGAVEESDGPTSRVMFEFKNVAVVELENYANKGYLKDFDLNDDLPIAKPLLVKCKENRGSIYTELDSDDNEFRKENNILKINIKSIYFDTDKFNVREDVGLELNMVLKVLKKYPKLKVELQSHTDSKASDNYNLELSIRRSKSIVNWMVNKGINPHRINGKGYGETQLVNNCANNVDCTEKEHQLNRRTEFVVLNPEVIN
jgi:outer membrane protein OmpA-like peptidoglycan-associated protein